MQTFGREQFGAIASPYLTPYLYGRPFLDAQYGIREDGDIFMIGDSTLTVDSDSDITIKGKHFRGTGGLWEPLTRKNVNYEIITSNELKTYKKILKMTIAHLTGYEPGSNIRTERGAKFQDVIADLFAETKKRGMESALARRWAKY